MTILQIMADNPYRKFNLNDLSEELSIDRSSVYRLLNTLGNHGLVRQLDGDKANYQIGLGTFALAGACRKSVKYPVLLNHFLRDLAEQTGENAHLAISSSGKVVFIDREVGGKTLSANTEIGDMEEMYCTAIGKILLCDLSAIELDRYLSSTEFQQFTPKTVTDENHLRLEIERVRHEGIAVDDEEFESNVYCMAVPVLDYRNRIPCAIGISGPKDRVYQIRERYAALLKDAARDASRLLGAG